MTAQELKNSILQLAIQGKLVKQNSNDEPASVLLEKIKEEREKLIKEKKIKREKYSEIYKDPSNNHYYEKFEDGTINDITEEIPFEIPDSWRWTRLGNICTLCFSGKSPKYAKIANNNFVIGQKNNQDYGLDLNGLKYCTDEFIKNYPEEYYLKNNDVLLNTLGGGTVGRSGIFNLGDNKYITDGHLFVFRTINETISNYLLYYLKLNRTIIEKNADGSTNQIFLKLDNVKKYLIPMPPLDEQYRIKNKINELIAILNLYNNKYNDLEKLNNSYKENLKKSILQYAIQGKLVKQDSNDESSEVLINRILDEKRELIKTKQIKKEDLSVIYKDNTDNQFYEKFDDGTIVNITDEIPFDIPSNWCWNRLGNISTYGMTKNKINSQNANPDTWLLDMEDIGKGGKILIKNKLKDKKSIGDKTIFKKGNILYSKLRPYLKKILIAPEDGICTPELVPFDILGNMNSIFIINYLKSPYVDFKINQLTYGAKMPRVGTKTMINLLIPIPPINEQEKIIKKINKILKTAE